MAIKATIYKAQLNLADMDRNVYVDTQITIARHPSESDERMMIRVLALALGWPTDTSEGTIELAKDMWEPDEPALWQKNTGVAEHAALARGSSRSRGPATSPTAPRAGADASRGCARAWRQLGFPGAGAGGVAARGHQPAAWMPGLE
jgi:hypothetical protein